MRGRRRLAFLLSVCGLASCQTHPAPGPAAPAETLPSPGQPVWRDAIRDSDLDRLARLDAAWREGLGMARAAGFARRVAGEGVLLDPAAAQPRAAPAPGPYRCRLIRLGAGPRGRAFTAYPSYFCHVSVDGDELALTKQTGAERPGGYLWSDGDRRMIFLGATAIGDEASPPAYGEDDSRDLVGIVERVAPMRYRLVLPWTRSGAKLDVIELIPYVPLTD
ncbi:hypothetical protein GCM10023232_07800 [Sphingosinicella ginsenosidimutans]|uniref:DUF4893 domain-containing protein n=1 Tax=Allosphingosinicella ginsenosidimutans TaxID=1176539 RepID=UPI00131550EE|nr:DUF4893 domain-containing protein [Sphingosinicella ginsenosidimutans]